MPTRCRYICFKLTYEAENNIKSNQDFGLFTGLQTPSTLQAFISNALCKTSSSPTFSIMANLTPTELVIALGAILLGVLVYNNSNKRKNYHPGPPRWPLIGNVMDMPTHHFWEGFHQWAVKYSENYTFRTPL